MNNDTKVVSNGVLDGMLDDETKKIDPNLILSGQQMYLQLKNGRYIKVTVIAKGRRHMHSLNTEFTTFLPGDGSQVLVQLPFSSRNLPSRIDAASNEWSRIVQATGTIPYGLLLELVDVESLQHERPDVEYAMPGEVNYVPEGES